MQSMVQWTQEYPVHSPWRMNGVPLNSSAQMKSYRFFYILKLYRWIMHLADYTAISIWEVVFTRW